ncbi:MAG: 1-deoxy-D-xylulose-5-phosphate reductoisomerase [bacterium]
MIGISVLGSTGSIGKSTLDVVARHPDRYKVVALTANRDVEALVAQVQQFSPQVAVMADEAAAEVLAQRLRAIDCDTQVFAGEQGLMIAATRDDADQVMAAIVGAAGLLPTLAAVEAGKRVLLANKEALVVAGELFMSAVEKHRAELLPIDSEHNAIFQCLPPGYVAGDSHQGVDKVLLTASGGPFRSRTAESLFDVTPEQAVAHPNWDMGKKISVDSATMMNKGLEVIEARWLFGIGASDIEVVVHPQSIIHSMVQYSDGSVLAQLGNPDMRTPIAHAMAWPDRIDAGVERLNLFDIARLDFERPDLGKFPCLALAYQAVTLGGGAPAVLNAANEIAVQAFLERKIGFMAIPEIIENALDAFGDATGDSIQALLDIDMQTRQHSERLILEKVH